MPLEFPGCPPGGALPGRRHGVERRPLDRNPLVLRCSRSVVAAVLIAVFLLMIFSIPRASEPELVDQGVPSVDGASTTATAATAPTHRANDDRNRLDPCCATHGVEFVDC